MIFLSAFSPLQPDYGVIFWTTTLFALVWFVLSKVAFKPIAKALKDREDSIDNALKQAEIARQEVAALKSQNEDILKQAREERASILKEANDIKNNIVTEARDKAKEEANTIIANAKVEIDNMKAAALTEVKNEVGTMAIGIAEKLMKQQLANSTEQQGLVNKLVQEMKLN